MLVLQQTRTDDVDLCLCVRQLIQTFNNTDAEGRLTPGDAITYAHTRIIWCRGVRRTAWCRSA
jgi:hypothetical protein